MKGCACLGIGCVGLIVLLVGGGLAILHFAPDLISVSVDKADIYSRYGGYLEQLNAAGAKSGSLVELVENLKELERPGNLVYLAVEGAGEEEVVEIVKAFDWSSIRTRIVNGVGEGSLGDGEKEIQIEIIEHRIRYQGGEAKAVIYLEYDPALDEGAEVI